MRNQPLRRRRADGVAGSLISTRIPTLLQNIRQSHVRYLNSFDINAEPLHLRLEDGEHVLRELAAHVIHAIMGDIIHQTSDRLFDLERQVSIQSFSAHLKDELRHLLLVHFQRNTQI